MRNWCREESPAPLEDARALRCSDAQGIGRVGRDRLATSLRDAAEARHTAALPKRLLVAYGGDWRTERDERPPGEGRLAAAVWDARETQRGANRYVPSGRYPPRYGSAGRRRSTSAIALTGGQRGMNALRAKVDSLQLCGTRVKHNAERSSTYPPGVIRHGTARRDAEDPQALLL